MGAPAPGGIVMPRPTFTADEEALIAYIRIHDQTIGDALFQWLLWVVASSGLFFYGFYKDVPACVFIGFIIALYQLCRFIYYQVKPSWRMGPIIDKYEAACKESGL